MRYPFLAFDIDGTILDGSEGIVAAMQYGFRENGYEAIGEDKIRRAVGLPLMPMVESLVPQATPSQAEVIALAFRTYFSDKGVLQAHLYAGVMEMLERLSASGHTIYAVTSKPEPFVMRVGEHLGFLRHFTAVHAPDLGLAPKKKSALLREMMESAGATPQDVLMIGDHAADMEAAHANQVDALGVSYGFGAEYELCSAGALKVVQSPAEVATFILGD